VIRASRSDSLWFLAQADSHPSMLFGGFSMHRKIMPRRLCFGMPAKRASTRGSTFWWASHSSATLWPVVHGSEEKGELSALIRLSLVVGRPAGERERSICTGSVWAWPWFVDRCELADASHAPNIERHSHQTLLGHKGRRKSEPSRSVLDSTGTDISTCPETCCNQESTLEHKLTFQTHGHLKS